MQEVPQLGQNELLLGVFRETLAALAKPAKEAKKKKKAKPLSSIITAERKRKRQKDDSSSSSSESEEEASEEEQEEEGDEEEEEGEAGNRRLDRIEKLVKKVASEGKDKRKATEGQEKLKEKFAQQLAPVRSLENREKIIFFQKLYADCAYVDQELEAKKFSLSREGKKRFKSVFSTIYRRIGLLQMDDKTPGLMQYRSVIETGDAEQCLSKPEQDRAKKLEMALRAGPAAGGSGRTRGRGGGAPAAPAPPSRRPKNTGRTANKPGQRGRGPACDYPACIASGNTGHPRASCWKDPGSNKYRKPRAAAAPAEPVPP